MAERKHNRIIVSVNILRARVIGLGSDLPTLRNRAKIIDRHSVGGISLPKPRITKGDVMADRKQFLGVENPNPRLLEILEAAKLKSVPEEELQEQRISFAYGNAPASSKLITKERVRHASKKIRLLS